MKINIIIWIITIWLKTMVRFDVKGFANSVDNNSCLLFKHFGGRVKISVTRSFEWKIAQFGSFCKKSAKSKTNVKTSTSKLVLKFKISTSKNFLKVKMSISKELLLTFYKVKNQKIWNGKKSPKKEPKEKRADPLFLEQSSLKNHPIRSISPNLVTLDL